MLKILRPVFAHLLILLSCLTLPLVEAATRTDHIHADNIHWQDWSADVFKQAKLQNRYILLNLEAVWCHWCHVMDKETYSNPDVAAELKKHYITVKVDHDGNPGLANQYRDYGWPATIVFDANGNEIVKRAGYIPPKNMQRLLRVIVDDPSPEQINKTLNEPAAITPTGLLATTLQQQLHQKHQKAFDHEYGSLKLNQKFLDRDSVEYAMLLARKGNQNERLRAIKTLDAALDLLDPEWGGFYQYSTQGDWAHPHYEKIMRVQAAYLRIYALAYAQFTEPRYLQASQAVHAYLNRFLQSANGEYYVSQDADLIQGVHSDDYFSLSDEDRVARGIPRVDTHIYAQENGWIIEALAMLYETSGDQQALQDALTASHAILDSHFSADTNGFHHNALTNGTLPDNTNKTYHLGDNLAMARAFLQLYRVTAERRWLDYAMRSADFIQAHFYAPEGGYLSNERLAIPVQPVPDIDENLSLARFSNLLTHYSGQARYREMGLHTMKFLARPDIALSRFTEAGLLLADYEMRHDPLHITVIGAKNDTVAKALFSTGLKIADVYKRIEWWDRREGKLPNADVAYPLLPKSAAFLCTDNRCSLPVFTQKDLLDLIRPDDHSHQAAVSTHSKSILF